MPLARDMIRPLKMRLILTCAAAVVLLAVTPGAQDDEARRHAAEQGDADAQFTLVQVRQDDAEAVRWYRLAAEQGHATAQTNLGFRYDNGRGVPEDDAEAVRWYRLAAEQGNANAQFILGVMYDSSPSGSGTVRAYRRTTRTVRWYRLAAEQGYAEAQFNLGVMYADGRGMPQDYVSAHMWFNLAAATGDEDARKGRDIVAARMTREQIAEAQARAREWANR